MGNMVDKEWDKITNPRGKQLAEEIDILKKKGLSAIQIASRLNLKVSVVWKYLHTGSAAILDGKKPSS